MTHAGIAEISEPVRGFVGFLEDDSKFRLEFGVRSAPSRGAIVHTYTIGRAPELTGRLLGFICVGNFAAEAEDSKREPLGPEYQIAGRHVGRRRIRSTTACSVESLENAAAS